MSTAATAWSWGTPALVSPAIRPAFDDAGPAGNRDGRTDYRRRRHDDQDDGKARPCPHRVQGRAEGEGDEELCQHRSREDIHDLAGRGSDHLDVGPDTDRVWLNPGPGQPPKARDEGHQGGGDPGGQYHTEHDPDRALVATRALRRVEVTGREAESDEK